MSGHILQASVRLALTAGLPVLSVSDEIETLLGFKPEDFLSSKVSLKERIHPHDSDIAGALFSSESQTGSGTFNIRLRHADGRIRCIKGHCTKHVGGGRHQAVLDLLLQDATSLVMEDVEELSMMANFRAMMENSEDYIYFKDRNHVFTAVSQTAMPVNRKSTVDVIGKTDYDLLREESADALYRLEEQIFAGLPMAQKIHELQIVPGKRCWVDNRMYPIKALNGEITGVWGIARDITRQFLAEETLRESEENLRESQAIAGLGSYVLDIRTGAWKSSDVLDEIFGIDKSYEHTMGGWDALVHPDDRTMMVSYFTNNVLGRCEAFDKEYRIVRQTDRTVRWVHGLGRLEFDLQKRPVIMRGTIHDITERKQVEETLREGEELLKLFIEHAPASLAMLDRELRYVAVSRRYLEDRSLVDREIIGQRVYEILPNLPESWIEAHRRGLTGEVLRGDEDRYLRADGTEGWMRWEIHPWLTGKGAVGGIVIFAEDITTVKEHEQQLEHIAHYDVLTGLPNRVLLADRLNQAMTQTLRRGKLVAVAYLDLDGFKSINDCHGHDAGDQLLAVVAKRMKKVLREGDTLARLGGDEFVAVLLDLENTEASIPMLNRLLKAASQPVQFGDLALQVTVSIGVTFNLQAEEAIADQLLRQADQAMYQAKLAGKNRYNIFYFNQDSIARSGQVDLDRIPPLLL